jgi:hypothetical protein
MKIDYLEKRLENCIYYSFSMLDVIFDTIHVIMLMMQLKMTAS